MKLQDLTETRFTQPDAISAALRDRRPGRLPAPGERLFVVAADHPGRGALAASDDPFAMASREALLERIVLALSRPGVNGFLGTPDIVEDLALLGALEDKVVLGSMNRAGLAGSAFEVDDRRTAYDTSGIIAAGLDGGKLLVRIDPDDLATAPMLERAAAAVDALAGAGRVALLEPFVSHRVDGRLQNDLRPDAVIFSLGIASALGNTSARTWLKVPCVDQMERVMAATTLPCLLLGGEVPEDADAALRRWAAAFRIPNVKGLVMGRALLFPRDGDVARAVDRLVEVL